MSLSVRVKDGSGAGRKRPLREPRETWRCESRHENPGYATRCLTLGCRDRRPHSTKETP